MMKINTTLFLIGCLILPYISSFANFSKIPYQSETVDLKQYDVIDITFEARHHVSDALNQEFGADLVDPNGKNIRIHGFYNGKSEWILRFSGNKPGVWKFSTFSSIEEFKNLNGSILILEPQNGRHGALAISPENPRKFVYEDGTSYFLSGFECDWLFALDGENPESAPKTEHLVSRLAQNGITQVVTTLYSYDVRWAKDDKLSKYPEHDYGKRDNIYPFQGGNISPDYSSLNIDFFKRFDRVVQSLDKNGIVAHLMIYVFNKNVQWPESGSEADNLYYDYVIKRYGAFTNVVWDVAKEIFRKPEAYAIERLNRLEKMNSFDRLVTVHDLHFAEKHPEMLDFFARQDWRGDIYSHMLKLHKQYEKPVFNVEHGGYEESYYEVFPGDYTSPEVCLRRNYMCYFAGVYANYYWQGTGWNVIIHNPFEQPDEFPKPKFEYYKYLADFFTKYDYNKFSPHTNHTLSGYAMRSDDGVYLFYIPKENYQLSNYGKTEFAEKSGSYQWFNTLTGEYSKPQAYNGGHFKNPWANKADAILIKSPQ